MDAAPEQAPTAPHTAESGDGAAPVTTRRKPRDPAARERAARKARIRRQLAKLETDQELAEAEAKLRAAQSAPPPERPKLELVPSEPTAATAAGPAPAPVAGRPGWPSEAEISAALPLCQQLWGLAAVLAPAIRPELAECFEGTTLAATLGPNGLQLEQVEKLPELVRHTAPLAAKYLLATGDVPMEVACLLGLFGILAQPFLTRAMEKREAAKAAAAPKERAA